MAITIADLWLLTRGDLIPDIRGTLISSRQVEREVRLANKEKHQGSVNWTAVELEEVIRTYKSV